jgi:hypothetical protein
MKTRITWSDDEWKTVTAAAYKICELKGHLPLILGVRYPYVSLFKEAQESLPVNRQRTWKAATAGERTQLAKTINKLTSQAATLSLKIEAPIAPITKAPEVSQVIEPAIKEEVKAPAIKAITQPVAAAFSFEGLGKQIDMYFTSRVEAAVRALLPSTVAAAAKDVAVLTPQQVQPELATVEDLLVLIDDFAKLKQYVDTLAASKEKESSAKVHDIKIEPAFVDHRPKFAVTGAHPSQVEQLKRAYDGKLRLQVFQDVCPAKSLDDIDKIYVFEKHTTKLAVDKLRNKAGKDRVVLCPGGMSTIKKNLDMHVSLSQATAGAMAASLFTSHAK